MDDPDAPAGTWVHWVLYSTLDERPSLVRFERREFLRRSRDGVQYTPPGLE